MSEKKSEAAPQDPGNAKGDKISPAASSWWGYRVGKP